MLKLSNTLLSFFVMPVVLLTALPLFAGPVQVKSGSIEKKGRTLHSGSDGATLKWADGSVIELAPDSRVRQRDDEGVWLNGVGMVKAHAFTLIEGSIEVSAPESNAQEVPTPTVMLRTFRGLSGLVRGGRLAAAGDQGFAAFANRQGSVKISCGGRWTDVPQGTVASLRAGELDVVHLALPPAPRIDGQRGVWLARDGSATVGGFAWDPTPGAASYRLRLSRDEQPVRLDTLTQSRVPESWLRLPPGVYALSVQGMTDSGIAGPSSPTLSFNVLGTDESFGTRVDGDGLVQAGDQPYARFTHTEGLLMSYGDAQDWAPATNTVPAYGRGERRVHFRHPDFAGRLSMRIRRRVASAQVVLGPKRVTWPGSAARVRVSLNTTEPGTGSTPPGVEVKLGLEPLSLEWHRSGGGQWWADVQPRRGRGPWVLRAVVRDSRGVELDRDVLEIVRRSDPRRTVTARR
jgi:hypothetical protein